MIKRKKRDFEGINSRRLAATLILPVVIYLLVVMVFPIIWALVMSLYENSLAKKPNFVGFQNYVDALKDPLLYNSIYRTLIYTFFSVLGKTVFGVIMALILNASFKFRAIFRSMFLLPWTIPTVTSVLTWKWLYSDVGGAFNFFVRATGISETNIPWLSTVTMSMISVIIVNIWRGTPFIGVSVLSSMQTVPVSLYEAVTIDGANSWQRFWYITVPYIKDVLGLSVLVTTIWTLNGFEMVWLLTRGGPAYATELISIYSYRTGFSVGEIGKAIAISFLFLPIVLLLTSFYTKRMISRDNDFSGG